MKKLLLLVLLLSAGFVSAQQKTEWQKTSQPASVIKQSWPRTVSQGDLFYKVNMAALKQALVSAPDKLSGLPGVVVSFPNTKGEVETYRVWENSNFTPELQAKHPDIRSYAGKGISDKSANINFSVSPLGVQTMVLRLNGSEFMEAYDKAATTYVVFDRKNHSAEKITFKCGLDDSQFASAPLPKNSQQMLSSAGQYKTLRLAMACNGEYAQHFGGTKTLALAGINGSMTRINALFENDMSVHMNIIDAEGLLFTNAVTDPFSDGAIGAAGQWNVETQNLISSVVGNAGYDIGHAFMKTGGGGNAGGLGIICEDDDVSDMTDKHKGSAFTAPESDTAAPTGDVFDFDFAAHEFGHQYGGHHSFSYGYQGGTGQIEPGSGCTTMAYAGVAGIWDVQPHNMHFFSFFSIQEMQAVLAVKTCPVSVTTTNATPVVNAGADYTIPKGTAFILTGTASDADATDVLTYNWEQADEAVDPQGDETVQGNASMVSDTKVFGPNWRTQESDLSPIRYMPKLSYVLLGQLTTQSNWESVSNVTRDLNFNFMARDNHPAQGQTNSDLMLVHVDATKGPLTVSSQNTNGVTWNGGSTQTVTWAVNNTNTLAGSTNVNIMLSTDGGLTFPTVLASNVPNNGSASITVPNVFGQQCRIMVKPTGNIYYAVNSNAFVVLPALAVNVTGTNPTTNGGSDGSVAATPIGGTSTFNYSGVNTFTGAPFNSPGSPANTATTVSSIVIPAFPAGTVINSATLHLNNVNSINDSFRDEIRVSLNGAYTLAATQISTANGTGLISPDPVINLPGFPTAGGTVNLQFSQTFEVSGVAATIGSANITIAYTKNGFTYLWSNGATTVTVGSLPAGTYSVTVTDAAGTTATGATTLTDPPVVTYSITATTGANGTVSPLGATSVASGGSQAYAITANTGYDIADVLVDGVSVGAVGTYTFNNVISAHTISAAFVVISVGTTWYQDLDGDTFGNPAVSVVAVSAPVGYVANNTDCNDTNAAIHPGAEICWNNVDDNCSNTLSEGCAAIVVNMTPSYNNTTLASLSTAVPAVNYSYPSATNLKYRFSIKNVTTNVTAPDIIQTSRFVTIPAAIHLYGATYTIRASAVINDEVVPFAGNIITVSGPTVQLITLNTSSCGATLPTLTSTLTANPGLNATGYTFRIRLNDANPTPSYGFLQSSTRFVGANTFTSFPLQYGASYKVSVQFTFNDPVTSLPVQSGYGAECTVNTPSIPLIGLASPTCGSQVNSLRASIASAAAPYATGYQFRIRLFADNGPTPTYYYSLPASGRFSSFTAFQGITIASNTEYSISVQYSILNNSATVWSGYGAECKITTAAAASKTEISVPFKAIAYPNPFANNFMLDVKSTSDASVNLKVYDMLGRLIEQSDVRISDMENMTIGDQYPSGIYNVVVSQEDSVQMVRVIKR